MDKSSPISIVAPYNMIIARYVEIGLKSRKVRNRMEQRLLKHIQAILSRESVKCEKAYCKWGRLIFEISAQEMEKTLLIFRNIIGIHSYSPVIQVTNQLDQLFQAIQDFSLNYLTDNDSFAVRVKRFKTFPKTSLELEREIGELVLKTFQEKEKTLHVDLDNPKKTIYLEVKEESAYLFGDIYYTAWGGNPIENDKAMFTFWKGLPGELASAFLLTRRGTVTIPVIFYDNSTKLTQDENPLLPISMNNLQVLSAYYSFPLPYIMVNMKSVVNFWEQKNEEEWLVSFSKEDFYNRVAILIISNLLKQKNLADLLFCQNKRLLIKGVIFSNHSLFNPADHSNYSIDLLKFVQRQSLSCFFPLLGLPSPVINQIELSLTKQSYELISTEFSLSSLIQPFLTNSADDRAIFIKHDTSSRDDDELVEYFDKWKESEDLENLIQQVLAEIQIRKSVSHFF
ncbi:MAG: hypothetical protein DRO88_11110 [Promethearchaeia archaeon]|nr:MAG: hypothetical protein DRO88_11110 [Candidatus Lokiarchaeia archaeon]